MSWTELTLDAEWIRSSWKHDERNEVLAVEKAPGHAPWDHGKGWQTVLLPTANTEHSQVDEYLAKNVSEQEAVKVAVIYRENNP